jgi:predicted amidohydrolase
MFINLTLSPDDGHAMIRTDMKAGFFQFNPIFGNKKSNLNTVGDTIKGADADLMVLPEFFATGYQYISMDEVAHLAEEVPGGETTRTLIELSKAYHMYIVAGLPERDGKNYFNSAVMTGPRGFIGVYRKTHLFFEETLWFKPGDTGFNVFHTEIGVIGVMICFDWYFPESMRALALQGAQVIAHPSNLVLPYCPVAMPIRCLENRVFAVTANRIGTEQRKEGPPLTFIGMSQIVAPDSTIVAQAFETSTSIMIEDIDLDKSLNKAINPYNDLFRDRRPEMYQVLGVKNDT